ncbi:hypothetical protein Dimus_000176 [Dionaea muscipula]
MGVVTVSSSASRATLGLDRRFSTIYSHVKKPLILAFKTTKSKDSTTLVALAPHESTPLPIDTTGSKRRKKRLRSVAKSLKTTVPSADLQVPVQQDAEVDYTEAAAKLENIYKLSPPTDVSDLEYIDEFARQGKDVEKGAIVKVVRNRLKRVKRLSLDKRIEMKKKQDHEKVISLLPTKKKRQDKSEDEKIEELVREYLWSADLVSFDWKRVKIPPVLPSSEHTWLFKLMQPLKVLRQVKENLQKDLDREPTDYELGEAMNMTAIQVRRHMEIGLAARNKLIKHNLRLVLFVMKKYFQEYANDPRFQDLCQAGASGLITAIDRFEHKRKFRLSTYSLFWIRHAIVRSMTVSSFLSVPFGLESVRAQIQRARRELMFELKRSPTEEEISKRVRITPERYRDIMRASRPVFSLNAKDATTQEELINGIIDPNGEERMRQPALLRLALDDVLDSLRPKESVVIRQRYGLDGRGDRTLGEIAGNLNISREMVRKYEMKALIKLKHPDRLDYLRLHM